MKTELDRSMEVLGTQEVPPYSLSYEITESHGVTASSAYGELTGSGEQRGRVLDIGRRVGDYGFDNTRQVRLAVTSQ